METMVTAILILVLMIVNGCVTPKKQTPKNFGSNTPEDIEFLSELNKIEPGTVIEWEEL